MASSTLNHFGLSEDEQAEADRLFEQQVHPSFVGRKYAEARAWYMAGFADRAHPRPLVSPPQSEEARDDV